MICYWESCLSYNDRKKCLDLMFERSVLLRENCPLSANKCLDRGQHAVKRNKKVASNNKHCFLEIYFQF